MPDPAVGVAGALGRSTAGVIATNAKGQIGVTVAGHAIGLNNANSCRGMPVSIGGQHGCVVSSDVISDSAFVELPGGNFPSRSIASRLQIVAPGFNEILKFSGLANPKGRARVVAFSPTVTLNHAGLQRHLFTDMATLPSDSGCAAFDSRDNLVGFCWGDSGTQSACAFSIWVWADSVFQAHGLS